MIKLVYCDTEWASMDETMLEDMLYGETKKDDENNNR